MLLINYLDPKAVKVDLQAKNKKEVLKEVTDILLEAKKIRNEDRNEIVKKLLEREEMGSTGIGYGIAIPHGKSEKVKDIVLAIARSKKGVDFDSLDGKPVNLFFLLVASPSASSLHLKALARLSRFLKDRSFRESLIKAETAEKIYNIIERREREEKVQL